MNQGQFEDQLDHKQEEIDKLKKLLPRYKEMELELEKRHITISSQETALHSYISIEKQLEDEVTNNQMYQNMITDLDKALHKSKEDCEFY